MKSSMVYASLSAKFNVQIMVGIKAQLRAAANLKPPVSDLVHMKTWTTMINRSIMRKNANIQGVHVSL